MPVVSRSLLQSVAVAVLSVGVALGLTLVLQPILSSAIFALFYLAVMLSALYGGMAIGTLACILALLACQLVFLNAQPITEPAVLIWLVTTSGIALLISALSAALRHVQRQAKANLRQLQISEERYRRIVETAHEGIWSIDADLKTDYVNQRMAELLGYSIEEMLGRSIFEFMDAEAQQQAEVHLARQQQGIREQYDCRYRRKDGSDLWAIVSVAPLINAQHRFVGALAMLIDISDRKHAEAARLQLEAKRSTQAREWQQAQEALRQSEARFQRLVEANIFGVAIGNFSGQMQYANDALLNILGYSRAELEAGEIRWDRLTPPEYLPLDLQAIAELRQRGVATPFEKEYIRKDKSRVPILIGGALLDEPGQQQETVICFYLDLSKIKRTEQHLKLYADIVENVQVGINVWQLIDPEDLNSFRLLATNPAASQIAGIDMSQLLGDRLIDSFPLLETHLLQNYREVIQTGIAKNLGEINYSAQRIEGVFTLQAFPLPNQCVGIVFEDITVRKQIEKALRDALQRLSVHFENSPLAVIERDRDLRLTRWSRSAEQIFGWQAEEVLGKGIHELNFIHPEDAEAVQELRRRLFTGEEKQNISYNRSYRKDGSIVYCEWYNSAVFDEAGNIVSTLSLVLDVTERKQAEQEREQLLAREQAARKAAEAANRSKDEFLAVLSHELRSPLNPILGWARLLQTRSFDREATARALETIERNAKIQAQLIEDLLDVSRIIRGKLSLTIASVSLISVIEAAFETVRLSAEAKAIDLQFVIEDGAANSHQDQPARSQFTVAGDASRLQQIVWNLLSNAIKFTPTGGRVEVRLKQDVLEDSSKRHERSAAFAQITVSDTGRGINPEFLPYVFDYFRQADSTTTRTFGGLGLGLAIVRHLTELHGGTVCAESQGELQGATFTVRLPLLHQRDEQRGAPMIAAPVPEQLESEIEALTEDKTPTSEQPSQSLDSLRLADLRILIVDDEPDMREFLAVTLEEYGAIVFVVTSATEALAALNAIQPDLLISDIGMPEVDGLTLMQQVRSLPPEQGGTIPAIALTAYASETDRQKALIAGFQQHVAKPVDAAALVTAIEALIQDEE